nr:TetR/AcrR family transcriptional regulator [Tessaracoccus bendigoensis]
MDRRAQIIEVATTLISANGYWSVSLHDIGVECGITDAAVLHHFGSKENLLLAVMEHRDEADRSALAEALDVPLEQLYESIPALALADVCTAMVGRNARQPEIVRLYTVLSAESLQPDHPVHGYFRERDQRAVRTFASARVPGGGTPRLARLVLATMDGLQLRWLRDPDGVDLVGEWEAAAAAIIPR